MLILLSADGEGAVARVDRGFLQPGGGRALQQEHRHASGTLTRWSTCLRARVHNAMLVVRREKSPLTSNTLFVRSPLFFCLRWHTIDCCCPALRLSFPFFGRFSLRPYPSVVCFHERETTRET